MTYPSVDVVKLVRSEIEVAVIVNALKRSIMKCGELIPFICPECHGSLIKLMEADIT